MIAASRDTAMRPPAQQGSHLAVGYAYRALTSALILQLLVGGACIMTVAAVHSAGDIARIDLGRAILLFIGVTIGGAYLIRKASLVLSDNRILYIGVAFHLKVALTLGALYGNWLPALRDPFATTGYDAQRYYFYAKAFYDADFDRAALPGINHAGIVYYFAVLFLAFGANPLVPALINSLTTLAAVVLVTFACYRLSPAKRDTRKWRIGLMMLVPEIVWYDALTSRESAVLFSTVLAVVPLSIMTMTKQGQSKRAWLAAGLGLAMTGILRPPLLLPIVLSWAIILVATSISVSFRLAVALLVIIGAASVGVVPQISSVLGSQGSPIEIAQVIQGERVVDTWTDTSVGRLLVPTSVATAILYTPLKVMAYLIAPFPSILSSFEPVSYYWQTLAHAASSLFYVLFLCPYLMAAHNSNLVSGRDRLILGLLLATFGVAIAMGLPIIHERYRIVCLPYLFMYAFLGLWAPRRTIQTTSIISYGALISAIVLYSMFKQLNV